MAMPDDVLTQAGAILYAELPEEYRYRDDGPDGDLKDLEAYLHGFGHLLDLIRGTTEQAYADGFAEPVGDRSIQPWLIPYLADLVGAELVAPDPERRTEELNNAVFWTKTKGTLRGVDHVGDVVAGTETVTQEGWRKTLTTPRISLPPFTVPNPGDGSDPLGRTPLPLGTPDFRKLDRAVLDPGGASPLFRLRRPARDSDGFPIPGGETVFWRHRARGGVPCFPGAYDDQSVRCPDLRDPDQTAAVGPHPRRNIVLVRPPDGLFEAGLREVTLPTTGALGITTGGPSQRIGPRDVLLALGEITEDQPAPDRIRVRLERDLQISSGARVIFEDLLFVGTVTPEGGSERPVRIRIMGGAELEMWRCAAEDVTLPGTGASDGDEPVLRARDSLIGAITGPNRFAELIHATVLGEIDVARLNASDSLLGTLSSNINCADGDSCLRFSRFTPPDGSACLGGKLSTNTGDAARFVRRWFGTAGDCTFRLPNWGEPGLGVLDAMTPETIATGAEDEGEMGAHHHMYHLAELRALAVKLAGFLPIGQRIAFSYDPMLALTPPALVEPEDTP
ncbi:MAG: hypothetical protein AAF667_04685 [Pseudomonadota bacterium]